MSWSDSLRWTNTNRYLFGLASLSGLIFVIDQITKQIALKHLSAVTSTPVWDDLLRLTLVFNEGGAFSTRLGTSYFYTFASVLVMIIVVTVIYRDAGKNRKLDLALALVLGGALGNLTDRLQFGSVIDFIDFDFPDIAIPSGKILFINFPGYALDRWPVFNVADSAITVGMVLLVVALIFDSRKKHCELNPVNDSAAV
ncbi:MAG: signal peptidase II [candidate division Zixibacteria bacterium]|nr:signal peptidase II [candidate division Zixibacteria bacterium]